MSLPAQPCRHLALEGCYNLRDLGGYPTLDGHRTRWRTVLRSDNLCLLPPASQQALIAYGLRTIIDLRWSGEVEWEPNVFAQHPLVDYRCIPFYGDKSPYDMTFPDSMSQVYCADLEREKPNIRRILESVLEPGTAPLLIHCAVGKDRTGVIAALLLGIANVATETIVAEYALSATYLAPLFESLRQQASAEDLARYGYFLECKPEFMADTLAYLEQRYRGVVGYVRDIGLTGGQIDRLRRLLVE